MRDNYQNDPIPPEIRTILEYEERRAHDALLKARTVREQIAIHREYLNNVQPLIGLAAERIKRGLGPYTFLAQ